MCQVLGKPLVTVPHLNFSYDVKMVIIIPILWVERLSLREVGTLVDHGSVLCSPRATVDFLSVP